MLAVNEQRETITSSDRFSVDAAGNMEYLEL